MANLKARSGSRDPKSGFRAFLERVSNRFRRVKPDAVSAAVGNPVSISVTPAEPPSTPVKGLVIESVKTTASPAPTSGDEVNIIEEDVNDDVNSSVFTLGFSAATNDLSSYALAPLLGSFTRNLSSTAAPKSVGAIPRGAVRALDSIAVVQQQSFPPKRSNARKRPPTHRTGRGSLHGRHSSLAQPRPDGHGHSRTYSDTAAIMKPVDVRSVLRRIGQEHRAELFEREEIDLRAFRELTEADLREMGIAERADRQAILGSIKKM